MAYDAHRRCWLVAPCATPLSLSSQFSFLSFRSLGVF